MTVSLPDDLITESNDDDPIHELDAIIDQEDIATPFHDALDFLEDEPELAEFFNPNLNIPRANLDFDDPEASAVGWTHSFFALIHDLCLSLVLLLTRVKDTSPAHNEPTF